MKCLHVMAVGVFVLSATGFPTDSRADEAAQLQADRYYQRALNLAKQGNAAGALRSYERVLPYRNETSDIYYDLVQVSQAALRSKKVLLYAQGFLDLEPHGKDAKRVSALMERAKRSLTKQSARPQEVSFDLPVTGARVFVNDVALDPSKTALLAPGNYQVRVDAADYAPLRAELDVTAEGPVRFSPALRKIDRPGKLRIVTEPAEGVQVFIDGKQVGVTPIVEAITLVAGQRYLVRFERKGWDSWVRYVTIPRDDTYELTPTMERSERYHILR